MRDDYIELASFIERFIDGSVEPWEWDHYCQAKTFKDAYLKAAQTRIRW